MKIYVASSWRNYLQAFVVGLLRAAGHEVYDFKNPAPGNYGFHWKEIGAGWKEWSVQEYRKCLEHPIAEAGFGLDFDAMKWADACVLVLPSGRSAHIEAGYFVGAGKGLHILIPEGPFEPELMYKMADTISVNSDELLDALACGDEGDVIQYASGDGQPR